MNVPHRVLNNFIGKLSLFFRELFAHAFFQLANNRMAKMRFLLGELRKLSPEFVENCVATIRDRVFQCVLLWGALFLLSISFTS